jgi:phosphatidylglycerophosphate synthase
MLLITIIFWRSQNASWFVWSVARSYLKNTHASVRQEQRTVWYMLSSIRRHTKTIYRDKAIIVLFDCCHACTRVRRCHSLTGFLQVTIVNLFNCRLEAIEWWLVVCVPLVHHLSMLLHHHLLIHVHLHVHVV